MTHTINTFANFLKRPQAVSLGLDKQSPPPWTVKSLQAASAAFVPIATPSRVLDFGEGIDHFTKCLTQIISL